MAPGLIPLKIPPGMFRNGTNYQSAGRWYDGSLIRWHNSRMKPWGGWRAVLADDAALIGTPRAITAWKGNSGFRYAGIGTNEKLYVSSGGTYTDVTPDDLIVGRPDGVEGPGYGVGEYGEEGYGTQRTENVVSLDAATWSFDQWGENLVAVLSSDGRIFEWSPIVSGDAVVVVNAPEDCVGVLVTDEEHMIALGPEGDRRKIQWSSQRDNTEWTVSDITTAGSRSLKTVGNLVCGRRVGSQPLFFTNVDVHTADYLGPPLVYGTRCVGENCGIISPNAAITDANSAYWMGLGSFFMYDGVVQEMPCDVQDYVFGTSENPGMNLLQRSKITVGRNSAFSEVTWFYPSPFSDINDRYVTYNYKYKIWYVGLLSRSCWLDRGIFTLPLAVTEDGVIYEHEVTSLADGASRNGDIFALSGPTELGSGDRIMYSSLMLPDADEPSALEVTLKMRTAPQGVETECGPYSLVPDTDEGYKGVRVGGRQASLRVEQVADNEWSLGTLRFAVSQGGGR